MFTDKEVVLSIIFQLFLGQYEQARRTHHKLVHKTVPLVFRKKEGNKETSGGRKADHFVSWLVVVRGGIHDHGLDGLNHRQCGMDGCPLRAFPSPQQTQANFAV